MHPGLSSQNKTIEKIVEAAYMVAGKRKKSALKGILPSKVCRGFVHEASSIYLRTG